MPIFVNTNLKANHNKDYSVVKTFGRGSIHAPRSFLYISILSKTF